MKQVYQCSLYKYPNPLPSCSNKIRTKPNTERTTLTKFQDQFYQLKFQSPSAIDRSAFNRDAKRGAKRFSLKISRSQLVEAIGKISYQLQQRVTSPQTTWADMNGEGRGTHGEMLGEHVGDLSA